MRSFKLWLVMISLLSSFTGINLSTTSFAGSVISYTWLQGYPFYDSESGLFNPTYSLPKLEETEIYQCNHSYNDTQLSYYVGLARHYAELALTHKEQCEEVFRFNENNWVELRGRRSSILGSDEKAKEAYHNSQARFVLSLMGIEVRRDAIYGANHTFKGYVYYFTSSSRAAGFYINVMRNTALRGGLGELYLLFPEAFEEITDVVESYDACIEYSDDFREVFDNLYYASQYTKEKANKNLENLVSLLNEMEELGLEDSDEYREGKAMVDSIELSLSSPYVEMRECVANITNGSVCLCRMINNGYAFNKKAEELEERMEEKINNSFREEEELKGILRDRIGEIEELLAKAEEEKLFLIDANYISLGVTQRVESIKEKLERAKERKREGEDVLYNVDELERGKPRGWLGRSLRLLREGVRNATESKREAERAIESAGDVVSKVREIVNKMFNEARGKANVEEVEALLKKGDNAKKLGDKFYYYSKAFRALTFILSGKGEEYEKLSAGVEDLIERAKADGLDVSEEEALFNYYKGMENKELAMEGFRSIKKSILSKAALAYGYLMDLRDEILELLPEEMKGELAAIEKGVVKNGIIDYEEGLGRLKAIESGYKQLLKEIKDNINNIASRKLEVYSSFPISMFEEKETEIKGYIRVFNPTPYTLRNVIVEAYSPIKGNALSFDEERCKAKFLLDTIEGYGVKTIEIEESLVPFSKTFVKERVVGKDGNAEIKGELLINSNVCGEKFYVGDEYEGKHIRNGILYYAFKPTTYTFNVVKKIEDAYEVKRSNYSTEKIGERYFTTYIITIKPKRGLSFDEVWIKVEKNASVDEGRKENGYVVIEDVDEEKPVRVLIPSSFSKLQELIGWLEARELTDEEARKLEEIKRRNDSSALSLAYELVEEVKRRLSLEEKLEYKLISVKEKISKELKAIERAKGCIEGKEEFKHYLEREEELRAYLATLSNGSYNEKKAVAYSFKPWVGKANRALMKTYLREFSQGVKRYKKMEIKDREVEEHISSFMEWSRIFSGDDSNTNALCRAGEEVNRMKKRLNYLESHKEELKSSFQKLKEEKLKNLSKEVAKYISEYEEARIAGEKVKDNTAAVKKELAKLSEAKDEEALERFEKRVREQIEEGFERLKAAAEAQYDMAYEHYRVIRESLGEEERKVVEKALGEAKKAIDMGEFGKAIRISKNILKVKGKKESNNNLLLSLLLLGAIAALYGYDKLQSRKKPKLRKLRRIKG